MAPRQSPGRTLAKIILIVIVATLGVCASLDSKPLRLLQHRHFQAETRSAVSIRSTRRLLDAPAVADDDDGTGETTVDPDDTDDDDTGPADPAPTAPGGTTTPTTPTTGGSATPETPATTTAPATPTTPTAPTAGPTTSAPSGGPDAPVTGPDPPDPGPVAPVTGPDPPDPGPVAPVTGPDPPDPGPVAPVTGPDPPDPGPVAPVTGPDPPGPGPDPSVIEPTVGPDPPTPVDPGPSPPDAPSVPDQTSAVPTSPDPDPTPPVTPTGLVDPESPGTPDSQAPIAPGPTTGTAPLQGIDGVAPAVPGVDPEVDFPPLGTAAPPDAGAGTAIEPGTAAGESSGDSPSSDEESGGLAMGVIIAIIAGVVVLVLIVAIFVAVKCCRRSKSWKKEGQDPVIAQHVAHAYYTEPEQSMPMGSSYGYIQGGGTSKYYDGGRGPPGQSTRGVDSGFSSAYSQQGTGSPAAYPGPPTGPPGGFPGHPGAAPMYSGMHAYTGSSYASGRSPAHTGSSGYGHNEQLVMHTRTRSTGSGTPTRTTASSLDAGTWRTMVTNVQTMHASDARDRLERALDNFAQTQTPYLGRFIMLSAAHRRAGGQGVVQFARGVHDGEEYAIKFFTQRSAFDREYELYSNPVLRGMMPAITHIEPNEDGSARSLSGWPMPPCIVIERGESLDNWALRIKPDFTTILQVLTHVVTRLQRLHDNALVHRDLKPGNVLWRPQHLEWTLIDFGCAAQVDSEAPLSFSLKYAAPEIVEAYEAKKKTIIATPAMDMWALGLMAYELLTDAMVFPAGTAPADVCDQITGRKPMPWEDPETGAAQLTKLRMLRRSLTSCLSRDPTQRPSSTDLLASWNRLFDSVVGDRTMVA